LVERRVACFARGAACAAIHAHLGPPGPASPALRRGTAGTSDVWSSADGVNWTQATADAGFVPRGGHQAFVLNNELCIAAGDASDVGGRRKNDTWCSADGSGWRLAYSVPAQFP